MSKPATEMRLARAAEGFTQVIGRGNAHIITKNPTTGKCAYDGQVGGCWHYGAGLETDTALEQDTDTNYWKMTKALYNIKVRKSFQAGDLVRWTDPSTGQYVILQPNNLSWIDNVSESQQFIASPAAVTGSVTDDIALWSNGYGTGRHFRYQAGPLRLTKHLIIDAASNLPAATVSNPYLEIAFVMTPSSGVSLIVDGTAWDKKTKKNTSSAIEFRTSGGVTLWSFSAPMAYDSAGNEVAGILQIRKQGANYIAAVRFPKSWINTAQFPITLDPTVDFQVGARADDCYVKHDSNFYGTDTTLSIGNYYGQRRSAAARWTGISIPAGATIDSGYVSVYISSILGTSANFQLHFDNDAAPTAPTSVSTFNGKTKTTASITWDPSGSGWVNSGDIITIIQELMDDNTSYSDGAMQMMHLSPVIGDREVAYRSWDYSGNVSGPKLHIEYTEASTELEPALVGGKLIFGGLTLNGLVGR